MDGKSLNVVDERLESLKSILPEAFNEGNLDWEKLRLTLGEDFHIEDERYVLNWAGKSEAFRAIQTPTTATLNPAREESVNFDATDNIFIEGENLEVLKVLQKAYYGKIKMIYIDPTYNRGDDSFIYPDRFSETREEYLRRINDKNEEGYLIKEGLFRKNSKDGGHYHSNWLSMMYPRLFLAKNLLRDDGIIFVSIGNEEIHNLRKILDEIFGPENFIECIIWNKRVPKNDAGIGNIHEYILLYVKNKNYDQSFRMPKEGLRDVYQFVASLKRRKIPIPQAEKELKMFYRKKNYDRGITLYNSLNENYEIWGKINVSWPNTKSNGPTYEILHPKTRKAVNVPDRGWRWTKDTFNKLLDYENVIKLHDESYVSGHIWFGQDETTQPSLIKYLKDVENLLLRSIISLKSSGSIEVDELFGIQSIFPNPKPLKLIQYFIESCTENEDLIFDFFAGSGTTGHSTLISNNADGGKRKFILVQLPELLDETKKEHKPAYNFCIKNKLPPNISEISKERIRRSIKLFMKNGNENTDLGFRVYKLRNSNFKLWRGDGIRNKLELEKQLDLLADPVKPEALEEDMLFELLLKSGFPLTTKIAKKEVGKAYYFMVNGDLAIVLSNLNDAIIKSILEIKPQQVICLDSLFLDNDSQKTNTQLQFKDADITFHSV